MTPRSFGHSMALILSTLIPWFWIQSDTLSQYTLQLAGGIVVLYIVTKKLLHLTNHEKLVDLISLVFINSLTQIVVLSTGGITSPFFFLLFLLLFAVALLFESYQSIIIASITSGLFIFQNINELSTALVTGVVELLLAAPLSSVFGKNYLQNLKSKGKIEILEQEIASEETDSLLWITTSAKPSLTHTIKSLSEVIIYLNSSRHNLSLPKSFLTKIQNIQSDLIMLYSSANELKNTLESESDNK